MSDCILSLFVSLVQVVRYFVATFIKLAVCEMFCICQAILYNWLICVYVCAITIRRLRKTLRLLLDYIKACCEIA